VGIGWTGLVQRGIVKSGLRVVRREDVERGTVARPRFHVISKALVESVQFCGRTEEVKPASVREREG
jgi:hypothetical protein